jgi:hypothetical protein
VSKIHIVIVIYHGHKSVDLIDVVAFLNKIQDDG